MDNRLELAANNLLTDERTTLEAFLDNYRAIMTVKLSGVSEENARRPLVPSGTSLGGLIKHLRFVESGWFQRTLAQVPLSELPAVSDNDGPEAEFKMSDSDTVANLIAEYEEQCALSRDVATRYALTDTGEHHRLGTVSLRWIYLHLIEETARHAGHADILREQLDGTVGPEI